ncbi:anthranilate phosphoribosyltransferase [Chengkuizengella axinellae]|uniref:Anthranilate phosphoribosyltransferase n=1 Tax=Chengkuizengella axinellae TaxID=3064388 RepID=A0ABT9IYC3_9BACL|nr:anthranilate phosphoribosyltransferase [Chengkuizengella sp. 2205SS18-9]MDP5273809.1 anthranilate phosphoribosyltransferase [Chengkuizengella sp. 2205SS18-9]
METNVIKNVLSKLLEGNDLDKNDARQVMEEMMEGRASDAQIGSLLTALRIKGETTEEVTGFAEIMRSKSSRVETANHPLLDTCGTGGDGANTFNISTASAIVAAAGGIRVAKHGNRAMSSKSGSADVLEALGININLDHKQAQLCIDQVGLCFMFAQKYHGSMKNVAAPRKELGFRTVFNMLGPLTNPANADRQLMGVFDKSKTELLASVLRELKLDRAFVVSSFDGLDEISISAPTQVTELKDGLLNTYDITPDDLGLQSYPIDDIAGGDAVENAEIIRSIFKGEKGARRNIVLANAGACFYVFDHCSSLQEGVKIAANMIDSGKAAEKLEDLARFTKEISHDT